MMSNEQGLKVELEGRVDYLEKRVGDLESQFKEFLQE